MPLERDAEPLPHRAVAAVGRDEIARPDGPFVIVVATFHDGGHTFVVGLERHELRAVLENGPERLGPLPQDRLQPYLGDEDSSRRARGPRHLR